MPPESGPGSHDPAILYAAKELHLLNEPGLHGVTFHGPTMSPFLQDGDELVVREVNWDGIRVGDIVAYRVEDQFPIRRVVRRSATTLSLRADNWPGFTAVIAERDVVGKVVQRRRRGRMLSSEDVAWRLAGIRRIAIERGRRVYRLALGSWL